MVKTFIEETKKRVFARLPKESVGVLPVMIVSVELGVSMVVGYLTARYIAGPPKVSSGMRAPSVIFPLKRYKVHLHHWLMFSGVLLIILIFNLTSPPAALGFLLAGLTVFGYYLIRSKSDPELMGEYGNYTPPVVPLLGVQIHHWIIFLGVVGVTVLFTLFLTAPSAFYGFLGGIVAQGIVASEDFPRFLLPRS